MTFGGHEFWNSFFFLISVTTITIWHSILLSIFCFLFSVHLQEYYSAFPIFSLVYYRPILCRGAIWMNRIGSLGEGAWPTRFCLFSFFLYNIISHTAWCISWEEQTETRRKTWREYSALRLFCLFAFFLNYMHLLDERNVSLLHTTNNTRFCDINNFLISLVYILESLANSLSIKPPCLSEDRHHHRHQIVGRSWMRECGAGHRSTIKPDPVIITELGRSFYRAA